MAYPQYNSVETINPGVDTTGRWKGFMSGTAGDVHFTTANNEEQTLTLVAKDILRIFPISIKKIHDTGTDVTELYGLN